jgi:hypothetical protein
LIGNGHLERMREALQSFILPLYMCRMRLPRLRSRARLLQGRKGIGWLRHRLGTVAIVDMS